jgi:uncharacterized membrane protein YccC
VTVGDLVGLLAGGGVCGTAVAMVWIVFVTSRADRRDGDTIEQSLRDRVVAAEAAVDTERTARRAAEDRADRLSRQVRDLGGEPVS